MKPKLVIVLGPTAVGKSEVALQLAQCINSEIVNADSQQVYRHMDIGTGKPSMDDQQRVRHHLIDIVDPDEEFNAAFYRQLATAAIDDIQKRGKNVVVCGGTGLYLKALTHGLFTGPGQDPELRRGLEQELNENGLTALYQRLVEIDASVLSSIHPNDRQRIIRALEVYHSTGKPISVWQKEHAFQEERFEVLKIGLMRGRAELYDLINRRSEQMLESGLLDEVRGLISRGYNLELKPLRSVGYRQIGEVLQGGKTVVEALDEMKQETRRLAKRQLTWYRADTNIHWYHPEKQQDEILGAARQFLERSL
jgi:tRNA dimethylallyltransferase